MQHEKEYKEHRYIMQCDTTYTKICNTQFQLKGDISLLAGFLLLDTVGDSSWGEPGKEAGVIPC